MYSGVNFFESSLYGGLLRTTNTLTFSKEPTGVAFGRAGKMFMTNDDAGRIQEITLGAYGRFAARDRVRDFSVTQYGSIDAEGIAYDPIADRIFIADGADNEIYEISPVDGVFGNGNDRVQHFDTSVVGVKDPESVEFDAVSGTLFTVGTGGKKVVELTTTGTLVNSFDISYLGRIAPAGITIAPRSSDPAQRSLYIVDRAVDNGVDPAENDGKIYEIAIQGPPPPRSPSVARDLPRIAARIGTKFQTSKRGTRISRLTVHDVPGRARIRVRCQTPRRRSVGARCPFKRAMIAVGSHTAKVALVKRFENRRLAAGTVIRIYVTAGGKLGLSRTFILRAARSPIRLDGCVRSWVRRVPCR